MNLGFMLDAPTQCNVLRYPTLHQPPYFTPEGTIGSHTLSSTILSEGNQQFIGRVNRSAGHGLSGENVNGTNSASEVLSFLIRECMIFEVGVRGRSLGKRDETPHVPD